MRRGLALLLVLALTLGGPAGCLIGSPVAAVSGEPYGMTVDDVRALQGKKGRIWSGAPIFAGIDLPFAFVLDTGFLPISLVVWGILWLASDEEEGDDHGHDHGEGTHDHGDGPHSHAEGPDERRQTEERGERHSD
jgi:uncharacterized protein YceK